jgi:tRNA threonylcarbamoyladenosine biosynthesis protein TsaB
MRTVALETTQKTGTIALFDGGRQVDSSSLVESQRSAQSLAVGLRDLLKRHQWGMGNIGLVAVTHGPGSFTGLRVGVTAAKTLAYAVGADVLGVNTLEAIAAAAPQQFEYIWAVMDAQRQELFAARFQRHATGLVTLDPTCVTDVESWLTRLRSGDAVSGPVLARLQDLLPDNIHAVDSSVWAPHAQWAGRLAIDQYASGRRDDVWRLVPHYFRKSAAEEKLEKAKGTVDST